MRKAQVNKETTSRSKKKDEGDGKIKDKSIKYNKSISSMAPTTINKINKIKSSASPSPQRSPSLSIISQSTITTSSSTSSISSSPHIPSSHTNIVVVPKSSSSSLSSSSKLRDKLMDNELRSFKNRGFHDGYDEGKKATVQEAFDTAYKKAFEQNFILSMLKGVANALKTSYNTPPPQASNSSSSHLNGSSSTVSTTTTNGNTTGSSSNSVNVNISRKHLSMLESMRIDETSDVESIKKDLIKICRENRLEILAHYVSQIG